MEAEEKRLLKAHQKESVVVVISLIKSASFKIPAQVVCIWVQGFLLKVHDKWVDSHSSPNSSWNILKCIPPLCIVNIISQVGKTILINLLVLGQDMGQP